MNKESISGILSTTFYVIIICVTVWGIFWSFYRHSLIDGVISIAFFPYGTYRGVASIWEEPKWKENWDEMTEQIAILIESSLNDKDDAVIQAQLTSLTNYIKEWISELPKNKKMELNIAARSYGNALIYYNDEFINSAKNLLDKDPIESESVIRHVKRFSHITGFKKIWEKNSIDRIAAFKVINQKIQESSYNDLEEIYYNMQSLASLYDESYKEVVTKKVDNKLKELFED